MPTSKKMARTRVYRASSLLSLLLLLCVQVESFVANEDIIVRPRLAQTGLQQQQQQQPEAVVAAFPSVFSTSVPRDEIVADFYKQRLGEMDLLHVDCSLSHYCRVKTLIHSSKELEYFQSHLTLEYDADATNAIVSRRSRRKLDNTSRHLNDYSTIDGFDCFLDYEGAMARIQDMVAASPSHVQMEWIDIGDSYVKTQNADAGHDIYALHLTAANSTVRVKTPMMILTGVHPREYAPPELVRQWIMSLLEYENVEARVMLESTDIYWIPYVNPDGRVLAETTQGYRRKNLNRRAEGATSCASDEYGVDINRNFPFRWGNDDGSSNDPCSQTFRGTEAASEPETQAVMNYCLQVFPQGQRLEPGNFYQDNPVGYNASSTTGFFVDIHSFGNFYIYPWGFENQETPNHDGYSAMVRKLNHFTGFSIEGPGPDFTTPASGATDDWAYSSLGASGMTWEIGTTFHEDCDTFQNEILAPNFVALNYAAKVARRPFLLSKGPDIITMTTNVEELEYGQDLTLTFQASDSAYSDSSYASATQSVAKVWIYVDQHPYSNVSIAEIRRPHWVFNSSQFSGKGKGEFTWNWLTLERRWRRRSIPIEGEHLVYLIAFDEDGVPGPLAATSIMVGALPVVPTLEPTLATAMPSTVQPTSIGPSVRGRSENAVTPQGITYENATLASEQGEPAAATSGATSCLGAAEVALAVATMLLFLVHY